MNATESAVKRMEDWAADDSHGYDQQYRWGEYGDFDCSSAVISAWELAGVPVKSSGATYTGNMRGVFLRCGFKDVTRDVELDSGSGLLRGGALPAGSRGIRPAGSFWCEATEITLGTACCATAAKV